jgi:integrase
MVEEEKRWEIQKVKGTWDRNLDYEKAKTVLINHLKIARSQLRTTKGGNGKRNLKKARLTIILILLIQLRNGARLSEAYDALYEFARTKAREVYVRLRKQKKEKMRLMIRPEVITDEDLDNVVKIHINSVYRFAVRVLGTNTHSFRYAAVTYWSRRGLPANVIARITGHSNLNHLITYTQIRTGEETLRNLQF